MRCPTPDKREVGVDAEFFGRFDALHHLENLTRDDGLRSASNGRYCLHLIAARAGVMGYVLRRWCK
jgi:hypothetical protein